MQIIKKGEHIWTTHYDLDFEYIPDDGTHAGYSFPCDKDGNIAWEEMGEAARENYQKCTDGTYKVKPMGVREYTNHYYDPPVGKCYCGHELTLYNAVTNECPKCERLYNGSGQDLLPRKYWNEGYDDYSDIGMY